MSKTASEGSASFADPVEQAEVSSDRPIESRTSTVGADVRHGVRLIVDYLGRDRWAAWSLVALFMALHVASSFNQVNFFTTVANSTTALAERNSGVFWPLLAWSAGGLALMLSLNIVSSWCAFTLRIRARQALTTRYKDRWLAANRFYHLDRQFKIDHPEQRIQEDVFVFVQYVVQNLPTLIIGFLPVFLYGGKLWALSQPIPVNVLGLHFVIEGFLIYAVAAFALIWTLATHFLGSGLTRAEIMRQRLEAQFRQEMAIIRENSEAIAFERGAEVERKRLDETFGLIRTNWRYYTFASLRVNFASSVPTLALYIVPTLLCAPFILAGTMKIGDSTLVAAAVQSVYGAVGIFIAMYEVLAILRSATSRLRYFDEMLDVAPVSNIQVVADAEAGYEARDLVIAYPDQRPMVRLNDLRIAPSQRLLITGPSGAGKSTLLRTIAGLWEHGAGLVRTPAKANVRFLPQRSFMPDGTLAGLMAYPRSPDQIDDLAYTTLLKRLGLEKLIPRLHEHAVWKRVLSPGEQQRIAVARVVLDSPDFLFLDEATSALDMDSENRVYTLIRDALPQAAIISVAHRPSVAQFHDTTLNLVLAEDGCCEVARS
ncbi:ATP-binding cassette domain-containing protein [Caulobacter sp.]|uniref:ABC transporter ATP-binding protein/permease n=1 Tax=Caulobacter sp. TaxID=78 RepID=UPI0031D6CD86